MPASGNSSQIKVTLGVSLLPAHSLFENKQFTLGLDLCLIAPYLKFRGFPIKT